MITSTHNPKIQRTRDLLSHSSSRLEQRAFVVEGIRLAEEVYRSAIKPESVFFSSQLNQRGQKLIEDFLNAGTDVEEVESGLLNRLSDTETSQGILAIIPELKQTIPGKPDFLVILDSIRDPGNMGTILRTACAAGVQMIFISPDCVDVFSPKVLRSAMGAHFQIPLVKMNWEEIGEQFETFDPNFRVYLSDVRQGDPLWQCKLTLPTALIVSNEATGASPAAVQISNHTIHIPMPGGFESLNASIAAGILLFEVVRQRSKQ